MRLINNLFQQKVDKFAVIFSNGPTLRKFTDKLDIANIPDDFYKADWISVDNAYKSFPNKAEDFEYIITKDPKVFKSARKDTSLNKIIVNDELRESSNYYTYYYTGYEKNSCTYNKSQEMRLSVDMDIDHIALNLISYIGYSKIYIIGMDHKSFCTPKRNCIDAGYKDTHLLINKLKREILIPILNIGYFL